MKHKRVKLLILGLLMVALFAFGFWQGQTIPAKSQAEHYKSLREVATFLFAVAGLWLGFIFPKAMSQFVNGSLADTTDAKRAIAILYPAVWAIGIVFVSLSYGVIRDILWAYPSLHEYAKPLRGLSFGLFFTLFFGLVVTTLMLLVPQENIRRQLTVEINSSDYHKKVRSVSGTRRRAMSVDD